MKLQLERVRLPLPTTLAQMIELCHGDVESAEHNMRYLERCEHWRDDTYHVALDREAGYVGEARMLHLSIKRHDREPIRDWRAMQALKNAVLGDDFEAVELYPSERRVVDTANQYHLWAFANPDGSALQLPFGWTIGLKLDDGDLHSMSTITTNAKQRAFEP